jgi:glutamine---fructose-6-phosphate transaminase (isomerizing)
MSDTPELRAGPPWAMEEMILAEPGLVEPILASSAIADAAAAIRAAGEPLVLAGCGTSEHAALAGAALLGARARDSFEASVDPQRGGALIAVTHEAGTAATLAALAAADATKIAITARPDKLGAGDGLDVVVATPLRDISWCHTVGYLSPLLALTALAGHTDPAPVSAVIEGTLAERARFADAAGQLQGCERLLVVGSGVDQITARELALKIEEGVHLPTTPLGLEKLLHGHLPAADARTGLIILRFDRRAGDRRDARARDAAAAVAELSMPTVTIEAAVDADLPPIPAALLAGALAAQLLTLELVLAAGTNPDLIRREEDAYRAAAAAAAT